MGIRRTVGVLAASALLTTSLAGCSSKVDSLGYDGMQGSDCVRIDEDFQQCTLTMTDTRKVTCIVRIHAGESMDCDWIHASGNDVM